MLRIIVISLFVGNLLLIGFQLSKPAEQEKKVADQPVVEDTSIPTIHLINELMQDWDLMSGNRKCFSLGPFHSSEERNEFRNQLLDVSAYISERQTQAQVEKGFWVFLPPYESLLEANRERLSLQALGLKDIGVIYEGVWKNAISLGYFLRQKNAIRRKNGLEERGYSPSMRVQRESEPRFWLDYEQNPGSALISIDMQGRPNDFLHRSMPCPESGLLDSESVPETGSAAESGFGPETGSAAEPGFGPETGSAAEPGFGPETGSEIETDLVPETGNETGIERE